MRKSACISIGMFLALTCPAQQIVIHPDMTAQQGRNAAAKRLWLGLHDDKFEDIKADRSATLSSLATIERIQQQVFSALTRVQQAVTDGRTVWYISQRIPRVFALMREATALAAQKPHLLPMVAKESNLCYLRLLNLSKYLQETLLAADERTLMDPAKRGELVRKVYDEVRVTEALAENIVQTLKMSQLQDAVHSVVPYKDYLQIDKAIIEGILRQWKY